MKVYTKTVLQMTDKIGEYIPVTEEFYEYDGPVAKCDRAAQAAAKNAANTAGTTAGGYGSAASGIGATLTPLLTRDATGGATGFSPTEKNAQLVAGEQGAGGAVGSVAGAAGLAANRTRNSGALSGVLDAAARHGTQAASQSAERVENNDAMLKQQKQMEAQKALQGLYGTNVSAQLGQGNLQNSEQQTGLQAGQQGWLQNTLGTISTLTGGAKNVAGAMYGGGSGFANS